LAQPRAITGRFSFEGRFTVQPGETASCSFPIFLDLQVHGSFQVLLDASGEPTRLIVHEIWSGAVSANGNYVIEHAAQTNITDLVSGDLTNLGAIHDQVPFGGVVIHDVGILRFDAAGNLTFDAGPHQGSRGDCQALRRPGVTVLDEATSCVHSRFGRCCPL
jgi:hypothetical protein